MQKRFSPSRSKVLGQLSSRKHPEQSPRLSMTKSADYNKYFCHYNNATYMGGMSGFKRHGRGILLHDDGSSVITEYLHDTPAGHNIIFRENSITSLLYCNSQELEVAYKQGHCILLVPFTDNSFKAHGTGLLIDYDHHKIYRLTYKRGAITQKILHLDRQDNQDAFFKNTITKIVGTKHEQAFSLSFQKPYKVHIKTQKSKTTIGYFDQDGEINGLGFTFYSQNMVANGEKPLYVKSLQRGYFRNSKLHVFGDKIFSNGNKYIGEFDKGEFHGYGLLVSPQELKWVYGKFKEGHLHAIQDSNYKQFTEQQFQVWSQNLRHLHQMYRERWIDQDIELPDELYLYNLMKSACGRQMTHIDPDKVQIEKEDQHRMSRIQDKFQHHAPGNLKHSKVEKELDEHYQHKPVRGPITIEELGSALGYKRAPQTPIDKFSLASSRSSSKHKSGEHDYLMNDPFEIQLKKVPIQSRVENNSHQSKNKQPSLVKEKPYQSLYRVGEHPPVERYKYKYTEQEPDGKYTNVQNHTQQILNQLRNSRERLNRSLQKYDQPFNRRQTEENPGNFRNYEQKYDNNSSYQERYVGKLTNKRHFNYETEQTQKQLVTNMYPSTSRYYPNQGNSIYKKTRSPIKNAPAPFRSQYSPSKVTGNEFGDKKKFISTAPRGVEANGNFLKNNYKYWT